MSISKASTAASRWRSNLAGVRLKVEYLSPNVLVPSADEVKKPSKAQERKLCAIIHDVGFNVPLTVNSDNVVIDGNARLRVAKMMGLQEVPVIRLEHLTEDQARLFRVAEKKLVEGREWDYKALQVVFSQVAISSPTLSLSRSGFSIAERDIIIGRTRAAELDDLAEQVELDEGAGEPVTRLGDVWQLGKHRIICGDSTDPAIIAKVVDGQQVRTVASDLPYNVKIDGHVSGLGKNKHDEFAMASGEMDRRQFTDFLRKSIAATLPHLVDGALLYLFMDWRHLGESLEAAEDNSLKQLNLLVWAKTNAGMGSFYRSAHEMIGLFKHGEGSHRNNVNLGRDGRSRTNVLHYPGANSFSKGRKKALKLHPTVKPVALMADLLLDSLDVGELVLDMFGGSGTTLIAAEKTDRLAAMVEISPAYVDITIRRYEEMTGTSAILAESGATFQQVAARRAGGEA